MEAHVLHPSCRRLEEPCPNGVVSEGFGSTADFNVTQFVRKQSTPESATLPPSRLPRALELLQAAS